MRSNLVQMCECAFQILYRDYCIRVHCNYWNSPPNSVGPNISLSLSLSPSMASHSEWFAPPCIHWLMLPPLLLLFVQGIMCGWFILPLCTTNTILPSHRHRIWTWAEHSIFVNSALNLLFKWIVKCYTLARSLRGDTTTTTTLWWRFCCVSWKPSIFIVRSLSGDAVRWCGVGKKRGTF